MAQKVLVKKVGAAEKPLMTFMDKVSFGSLSEVKSLGFPFAVDAGSVVSTMIFKVGNAKYNVNEFLFYNEEGDIVARTHGGYFEGATYGQGRPAALLLPSVSKLVKKDNPEPDGTAFFISLGKDRFGLASYTKADVYLPLSFLDSVGYEVFEEKWGDNKRVWETTTRQQIKTDRVEVHMFTRTDKDLIAAKRVIKERIDEAATTGDIRKIFEDYKYI